MHGGSMIEVLDDIHGLTRDVMQMVVELKHVELCNMLAALPAVEATPVVHGRCIRCGAKMDVEGGCRMTEKPCIMPEMPYCPACKYGLIVPIDETECEWKCLYDGSGLL